MGLGNAALAGFLALAALPILVHLLFRRRARRIPFPTLRLLRTVDPHLARRRRLHELLLLALRTALLLLAVLAVLRPYAGASAAGPQTTDRVVVLDDSASMALGGDSPAFAEAVAAARGLFTRMRPGDRAALHRLVAGPVEPAGGLTQDARALVAALERARRTDGRGSLSAAVRRAGEALAKGTSPNRALVLLTDLDAGAFADPGLAQALQALPEGTQVVAGVASKPAAARDVAVTGLSVAAGPCVVGRPLRVVVGLLRRAGSAATAPVRLAVGAGVPEEKSASFSAAGTAEVAFDVTPAAAGPLGLEASVDPDDFAPDDRRYRVVDVRAKIAVALVDGDLAEPSEGDTLSGGSLLALALDPPGDGSLTGIAVTRRSPSDAELAAAVGRADVLVVHDAPDLPDDLAEAVAARHRGGAGLLVVAGRRASKAGRAVPEALDALLPARAFSAGPDADPAPLVVAAPDDALLAGLAPPGSGARLEGATARLVLPTGPDGSATTLLTAGGRPVLLRGPGRPAPALLLAMPLDPAATNWALRPTFLAWLHGLVPRMARGGAGHPTLVAGEGGAPRPVLEGGLYDLDHGDAAFAVDADPREAEPARLDPEAARVRLGGAASVVPAAALEGALARAARTDLTGLFLVLAAAALLAETVLANAARRRLAASTREALAGARKDVA